MAEAPKKASARTTLKWGSIEVPVGLFKTTADPAKELKFEQGGPNGGRLVTRAASSTPAPATRMDPLAEVKESPRETSTPAVPTAVPVLVEEGTEQVVERSAIHKGVWRTLEEDEDGNMVREEFIDCTDALAHIEALTALEVMEIQGAIDVGRVPRERVIGSYYVGTDGEGTLKVLELLAHGMVVNRRALVVKWTKTRRQATGVLVPLRRAKGPDVIVLLQLAWAEDWRDAPDRSKLGVEEDVRPTPKEYERASELVQAMADSSLLLEEQRDDALALREEVYALALDGDVGAFKMPAKQEETPLLDSLEESLAAMAQA